MDTQKVKGAADDVHDAANEIKHRVIAEGEHLKREVAGDKMTTGDKVKSGADELKNRVEAEFDRAKRDVRHDT
ncbi:MAG: hypothetical protein WB615_11345 [Candidatus Tumulicola sp.]